MTVILWYNRYMDKIRFRDLQRWCFGDIEKALPIAVTHDSQSKLVVLGIEDYNRLVSGYEKGWVTRHDSQSLPIYDKEIHKAGDRVLVRMGKRLVPQTVPPIDSDGNLLWEY